ncbi:DUF3300 domain-containing protein [Lysobacter arvi]|uniref:DUF3300 domain-containing protein n=1 Tax=Lysobacter arvi TaxID=3038776 RepID=A0ABU1CAG3_9GAMM|nr:DUF3300 domain-containing protein [Lysobacter arvi]MDR0182138.1 DUF3300 domain-containing protein [Lysobacter arvi]
MRIPILAAATAALLSTLACDLPAAPLQAPSSSASANTASSGTFTREELDQMMAPIALYPDALLAQILMASTYPGDVSDAVAWSKAHQEAKGEDAVKQVANEPWDPSVQSLVAFPQLLAVLGQDPKWVQRMGDAFLAQPDAVMESVQRLRRQADAAGNLQSNEQQKVTRQAAPAGTATVAPASSPQTIVIESAQPDVVYVPSYNPSVVYGTWMYPSYPPYYYPPPAYYYPGGALLSFGIGVAVGGALWGDLDWGHGDIDIDVNRYNEFNRNTNRNVNRDQISRDGKWQHNAANRDGVPYRDNASREQFGRQLDGAGQRDAARGRDPSRDAARTADRDRARQTMQQRGFEAPAASNREAQQRAGQASRDFDRSGAAGANRDDFARSGQGNAQARQSARDSAGMNRPGNSSAFQGASNPAMSRSDAGRGQRSMQHSQRPAASRSAGHQMSRPSRPPMRGGGGRRR